MSAYEIIQPSSDQSEARLGRLRLPGRNTIHTPHYVAITSRGTVPHITQDLLASNTAVQGVYAGLEDYVEQLPKPIPACSTPCQPGESPLRRFICLHPEPLLVLGPRRIPPLSPPTPNTYTSISISTSYGFRQLEISDYITASEKLRPDIAIAPVDYELGEGRPKPGLRRRDKMGERTLEWVRGMVASKAQQDGAASTSLWAPMLPIEPEMQQSYLDYLEEEGKDAFGGLALYETDSITNIPSSLHQLPRIDFSPFKSPQDVLRAIDLGIDILALPFITTATDSGVAFTFSFPSPSSTPNSCPSKLPLGLDMWSKTHCTTLTPLSPTCTCYTCTHHHRAYLQHLLSAKEMLAWTLLQIHNHHQTDLFFAGIRQSIAQNTFATDVAAFSRAYEDEFPAGSGAGPRLRGYQIRIAEPGPPRANLPARRKLDREDLVAIERARAVKAEERERKKEEAKARTVDEGAMKVGEAQEAGLFAPDMEVGEMEEKGFAEKE